LAKLSFSLIAPLRSRSVRRTLRSTARATPTLRIRVGLSHCDLGYS
jgi:hypothetical protein